MTDQHVRPPIADGHRHNDPDLDCRLDVGACSRPPAGEKRSPRSFMPGGQHSPSRTIAHETRHTVSLVEPFLLPNDSVLDVGCGAGYVASALAHGSGRDVHAVDIGDFRRVPTPTFAIYDGRTLPFPEGRFEVVLFSFVLHHVPDLFKPLLLGEARRVARRRVIVIEDTPVSWFDRLMSWRHGWAFRRKIGSRERFGFLSRDEWVRLFGILGMPPVHVQPLSRWSRSVLQPYARALFVCDVGKRPPLLQPAGDRRA